MGDADLALLAHHGVFVLGANVNAAYWRAASLEWRGRNAWLVETGGGGTGVPQLVHDPCGRRGADRKRPGQSESRQR
jgi:ribulose-5-phosphate 4-epimerase/fuculose-1-phosphate aldolase